jgi:plasmid maintenance system killer protein
MSLTQKVNDIGGTLDIIFRTTKLAKTCNDYRLLQKAYGERRARLIRLRLDELQAANTLSEISHLPPARMHQLTGKRQGQISLDLDHPYRLLITVANNPIPKKANGNINLSKVTAVMVLEVKDTHD